MNYIEIDGHTIHLNLITYIKDNDGYYSVYLSGKNEPIELNDEQYQILRSTLKSISNYYGIF